MKKASLLALACIGTAAILMFTTDKGKKIRGKISDKASDWGDTLSDLADDAGVNLKELQKRVKKEVKGLSSDAVSRIQDILDEGSKRGKKIKAAASDAVE